MANRAVKSLALQLAVAQLFAQGLVFHKPSESLAEGTDKKEEQSTGKKVVANGSEIILVEEGKEGFAIYQRYNEETGELEPLSIFDDENINSRQYGASQNVFRRKFDQLIEDPLILEEMHRVYPVEGFESEEEAMFFYEKYFDIIYDCGCGYAAAADFIFRMFEGKEQEFFDKFGFPMYTFHNNEIDYNYELMMLKFFNFVNLEDTDNRNLIWKSMEKDIWEFRLFRLLRDRSTPSLSKQDIKNWSDEDWDNWRAQEKEREGKVNYLSEKYKNAKNQYTNFGITTDARFGYLYIFLAGHGIQINTRIKSTKYREDDDIIACGGFTLYPIDANGNIGAPDNKKGDHYMYITDIEDDGDIIVSSWGEKYLLDCSNSSWSECVELRQSH